MTERRRSEVPNTSLGFTPVEQRERWIKALNEIADEMQTADSEAYEAVCTALGTLGRTEPNAR